MLMTFHVVQMPMIYHCATKTGQKYLALTTHYCNKQIQIFVVMQLQNYIIV